MLQQQQQPQAGVGYAKRVQTVQDWTVMGQKWQNLISESVAPHLSDFFLSIYHACTDHADQHNLLDYYSPDQYTCQDHFLKAVEHINWEDFMPQIDKIVARLPELSASFKTYFVTEAWVITSVRLQANINNFQVALPTKRKIIQTMLDEAATVFLSHPDLIKKPKRVIDEKLAKSVPKALIKLVKNSEFMEDFLKSMRAENNFAPPVPTQPVPPPTKRSIVVPHVSSTSSGSAGSSSMASSSSSSSVSETSLAPEVPAVVTTTTPPSPEEPSTVMEVAVDAKPVAEEEKGSFHMLEEDGKTGEVHVVSGDIVEDVDTGKLEPAHVKEERFSMGTPEITSAVESEEEEQEQEDDDEDQKDDGGGGGESLIDDVHF
jgi:hypothetical protein